LELAALAVRERAYGDLFTPGQADPFEHRIGLRALGARWRAKHAVWSATRGHRERDVLSRGKRREQLGALVDVSQSEPRALPCAKARDVATGEPHRARGRRDLAPEDVDERRLSRPVRSDDRAPLSVGDLERHAIDRDDAAERATEVTDLDHRARTRSQASRPSPT